MQPAGYPVTIDRRVFVTVSDGTRIALTTYLPDAPSDGPFPTIVESLPYRKDDDCTARDYSTYAYLAARGFAGVRIDIRGTGASTGVIADEYLAIEQADNLEILDWIGDQPWSTGRIGMWGISWGGFSSLQTAMLRPPRLEAIVAMHATHDRFACDVHYTGGSLHAAEQADWPGSMITTNALPPDPDIVGYSWFEEWMERLERTPQWPLEWLRHQTRDAYWMHGSPAADYEAIRCPTLLIGGWLDGYVDGILALAEHLECPTRTVVGPWGHFRPSTGEPGPTLDHLDLMARWFGHHLRGDANGIMDMPAATVYVRTGVPYDDGMVEGHWRAEEHWPPPDLEVRAIDLEPPTRARWAGPQWVGSHAPAWDRSGITTGDGGEDDEASIAFESGILEAPLEILGTPVVTATVTTDQPYGLVAARLLVVSPDGSSHLITRGSRNLAFPKDLSTPRQPVPGETLSIGFPLLATSAVVPPGSKLRLAISGADFPVAWPPPGRFTLDVDPERVRLELPIVPVRDSSAQMEIPPAPPPPEPPTVTLADDADFALERDRGATTFRRSLVSKEHQPDRGGLTYTAEQDWTVTVEDDDPGSTRLSTRSSQSLERPGWEVEVVGTMDMSGRTSFDVDITLRAFHDGSEVWQRSWSESIPRTWA